MLLITIIHYKIGKYVNLFTIITALLLLCKARSIKAYSFVYDVVLNERIGFESLEQVGQVFLAHEELEISLLIDVAVGRAPTEHGIGTGDAVDVGLRVDGEHAKAVESHKLVAHLTRLRGEAVLAPRKRAHAHPARRVRLAAQKAREHAPHVALARQLVAPLRATLLRVKPIRVEDVIVLEVAERRRRRVAPAAVRELVPVGRAAHVRLGPYAPEDRTHLVARAEHAARRAVDPRQRARLTRLRVP